MPANAHKARAAGSARAAALRLAALALACLAFFGPVLPVPSRSRSVAVLIDASASMGARGVERSREAALAILRGLSPRDRAALLVFAGRPRLLSPPTAPAEAVRLLEGAVLDAPDPGHSDLAAALAAARSAAAAGPGKPLVALFSDGRANSGGAPTADSTLPLYVPYPEEDALAATEAPARGGIAAPAVARPGELVGLTLSLSAASGSDWELRVDGRPMRTGRVPPGIAEREGRFETRVEIDAGPAGSRELELSLVGPDGRRGVVAGALLRVAGASRVLAVSGAKAPSPIAAALSAQGIPAVAGGVELLPERAAGYDGVSAVVLDDVHALALGEGQQEELLGFVAGGGGLLVVGGPSSLGRGEYYSTRLEEALPVATDSRRRFYFTRAKLLFVVDRSGSMTEKVGAGSKQLAAMRGVAAALAELGPQDEAGVLAFDSEAYWIMPFRPAGEAVAAIAALSGMGEGGGTDLSRALEEALAAFGERGPTKRHVVVLSDGLTVSADFDELAARFREAGVSVSTVGIGAEVDEELLARIAAENDGAFYRAELDAVPLVLDKETVRLTRDAMREGVFSVRAAAGDRLAAGLAAAPTLGGLLATRPKEGSLVRLAAVERGSGEEEPLLVAGRFGLGSVAVFAADSGARWLKAWRGEPAYNRLWAEVMRSLERPATASGLRASASVEGAEARIVVAAVDAERRSLSGLRLAARPLGGGSPPVALRETAPGRYEGRLALAGEGLLRFEVADPAGARRAEAWAWNPPGSELALSGADEALLGELAASSGGGFLDPAAPALPAPRWAWRFVEARAALLALALAAFLAELAFRAAALGLFPEAFRALKAWWRSGKAGAEATKPRWLKEEEHEGA